MCSTQKPNMFPAGTNGGIDRFHSAWLVETRRGSLEGSLNKKAIRDCCCVNGSEVVAKLVRAPTRNSRRTIILVDARSIHGGCLCRDFAPLKSKEADGMNGMRSFRKLNQSSMGFRDEVKTPKGLKNFATKFGATERTTACAHHATLPQCSAD